MRAELLLRGLQYPQRTRRTLYMAPDVRIDRSMSGIRSLAPCQRSLAARHRQINLKQDLRIEQGAVQLAARVVHAIALAQCIKRVPLTGMHLARQRERIENRADATATPRTSREARELRIQTGHIEGRAVDHALSALEERQ